MKTLLLILMVLIVVSCQKEDEELITDHKITYVIESVPDGFDIKMTNNNGDTMRMSTNESRWTYSFYSYPGKQLYIKATPKQEYVSYFKLFVYINDTLLGGTSTAGPKSKINLGITFKIPE